MREQKWQNGSEPKVITTNIKKIEKKQSHTFIDYRSMLKYWRKSGDIYLRNSLHKNVKKKKKTSEKETIEQ